MMMEHIKIIPFSATWWTGIAFLFLILLLVIFLAKKLKQYTIQRLSIIFGYLLIIEVLLTHLYLVFIQNTWSLQDSLPLHLCRISVLIAGFALITQKQFLYEWSVYLGLPGGLHSILTPELTQGDSLWMIIDYYTTHTMLIVTPIYLTFIVGKCPRDKSIWRIFVYVNILAAFVFPLNFVLNSNYMYLAKKPIVDNPFLIGEWPWYILCLELVGILHMLLMDIIFRLVPKYIKNKKVAEQGAPPDRYSAGAS